MMKNEYFDCDKDAPYDMSLGIHHLLIEKKNYPDEIIKRLREAMSTMNRAAIMADQIDALIQGKESEKTFLKIWERTLA